MDRLSKLVQKLSVLSEQDFYSPFSGIEWPEALEEDAWYFTPELISLYGTATFNGLDVPARKRLSRCEAVNFFSLNIHGEKSLIEGMTRLLYRKGSELYTRYLHHFLDEENKHMVYFGNFCLRYAGRVYPDRKMAVPREYAPGEEEFLFFARVLVFEEIVDLYNRRMAEDDRLHWLAREINRLHHKDETRHLAFGRQLVQELFDRYSPEWSTETLSGVQDYLSHFIRSTWQEYYNPAVYKDAGLPNPYRMQREVLEDPATVSHRSKFTRPWLTRLMDVGVLKEEPEL